MGPTSRAGGSNFLMSEIHCWLDFFLVSVGLVGRIFKADILPGYKADQAFGN